MNTEEIFWGKNIQENQENLHLLRVYEAFKINKHIIEEKVF
jgi:hypothetical protein